MKNNFSILIDKRITDESFMEHCLNLKSSGYDPTILIGFYSLGKNWHYTNVLFLCNLLNQLKGVCERNEKKRRIPTS
jgi:hypothetical protein